jgi:hypothetical protein
VLEPPVENIDPGGGEKGPPDICGGFADERQELLIGLLSAALKPAHLRKEQAGLEAGPSPNSRAGQPLREREVVPLPCCHGR